MTTLTAVSTFAGVGSTARALQLLGLDVLAVERDATAVATLRANGIRTQQADVKELDWASLGHVDVLTGGPPCQPWSQGGLQNGVDDERDCIPAFLEGVRVLRPRLVMMEEVWTLTWRKNLPYLQHHLQALANLGYAVEYRVLDMSEYGIPQARKRLFVLATRSDFARPAWPVKRSHKITMAQALGWTPEVVDERVLLAPVPNREAANWVFNRPSTTVVGSFRPDVQAAPGYRKAGDGPRQNTPGSVVTTERERKILQGLPADWKIEGNQAQRDLQIGNSCPLQMTMHLVGANLPRVA